MEKITDWFEHWFDTKYYHLLYDNRDEKEAEFFMKNLILFLELKKGSRILDLPCGKGRHSVFLNSKGFNVVGADLSRNSIDFAKRFENKSLLFRIHDMRDEIKNKYKAIFNLFTSFGYFNDEVTNISVLRNFKNALETDGFIVIDFLNIIKIKHHLIKEEIYVKNGIEFQIKRNIQDEFLVKNISFQADGKKHNYIEKVQYLTLEKFNNFAEKSQLVIKHVFGNYDLMPFDEYNSDRLIIILQ